MSINRRFFLVGAGALITTSFVSKAVAYAKRASQPLLVTPDRIEAERFIYGDGRISLEPFILEDNEPIPLGVSIWRKGSAGLSRQDLTLLPLAMGTLPSRNSIHYLVSMVGRIAGSMSEAQLREHTGSSIA